VFFPAAMDPIVTKGVADGVPTFFMNSGLTSWKKDGAIAYIGEEPFTVGKQAGDVMAKAGVKHALCINHVPGNPLLELRCDGLADALKAGGAKVQVLAIPSEQAQNPQAVLQAIKGVLQATPTIDGIFTLGSAQSVNAIKATDELGITEKVFVGTVDISNLNLQLVQQKKMRFILDQQPYIQGFYSIVAAYQYARYRVFPIGQIVTSPFIITPDNVEEILAINKKYGGVRGAL
jgi:simple sugar transport system substrate-binding protein